jgi:heme a synthase
MPDTRLEQPLVPRALHYWAVLTVVATVGLLAIGSVVTTFRVGMADPVWPTYPWHLLLISYDEPKPGFLIEHSHRLAGYIVGCCAIVLAVWLQISARRAWLKWLGWGVLVAVSLQGVLGGLRVYFNALKGPELAAFHGVLAQLVFSLIASMVVFTARGFPQAPELDPRQAQALQRLGWALTCCVFLQVVWGALTRHFADPWAQRLHFLTAFAVVAVGVWFARTAWEVPAAWQRLRLPILLLMLCLSVQLLLGVEAWLARFGTRELPELQGITFTRTSMIQAAIRTGHLLLGSWLLALSVACALLTRTAPALQAVPKRESDGVAGQPVRDAFQAEVPYSMSVQHLKEPA